jgi:hypothetical protein
MSASAVLAKIFMRSVCIHLKAKQSHGTIHFGQVTKAIRPFLIATSATSGTAADWRNQKNEKGTKTDRVMTGQVPDRGGAKPRGQGRTAGTGPDRGGAKPRGQGRTAGAGHLIVAAVASCAMPLRSFSLLDSVLACAKLRYNARLVSDVGVFNPRPKDCGSLLLLHLHSLFAILCLHAALRRQGYF